MQLTIPQRSVADTQSFPVDPEGVNKWLAQLQPIDSLAGAREVYRGLKHSNRLHNDVDRRRAVLACFIPVLRELQTMLMESSRAQPMPLTREFHRAGQLADGLLREEVFAFKILLADSDLPIADDVRRAMHALARQAEASVHGYRTIPEALISDAHQLYELAERHNLIENSAKSDMLSTDHHYRYILLLCLTDAHQQRVRQVPLLLPFLQDHVDAIAISNIQPKRALQATDLAVHLRNGTPPTPAASLLVEDTSDLRYIDIRPLLERIDATISRTRNSHSALLGSDILERQSMARLRLALSRSRQRRAGRLITHAPRQVVFGHKAICAALHFAKGAQNQSEEDVDQWTMINQCPSGAGLMSDSSRAGLVQVGELVTVTDPESGKRATDKPTRLLGVVRWMKLIEGHASIRIGVEFLARGVLPISVMRDDSPDAVADDALIIACKVHSKVMQTMLLPSYMYESGNKLSGSLNGKLIKMQLKQCLQTNGLFSQFSLTDS